MIKAWKDTAFGSDFGSDILELIESNFDTSFSMQDIYQIMDIQKYLLEPKCLQDKTDNNVYFLTPEYLQYQQYVHFENGVIALSALIIEAASHPQRVVDLRKAYGSKALTFNFSKDDIVPIYLALQKIAEYPDHYVLFELLAKDERESVLNDIRQMLCVFDRVIRN